MPEAVKFWGLPRCDGCIPSGLCLRVPYMRGNGLEAWGAMWGKGWLSVDPPRV